MIKYDASRQPDPHQWLAASESERIEVVREYHRHLVEPHPDLPDPQLHASIHTIVENQVALGDETPVLATVARLMADGLSRHEALHAVGFVLASHMADVARGDFPESSNTEYYRQLARVAVEERPPYERHQHRDAEEDHVPYAELRVQSCRHVVGSPSSS